MPKMLEKYGMTYEEFVAYFQIIGCDSLNTNLREEANREYDICKEGDEEYA